MSRMKSVFAVLLLTAIAGVVPQAHAQATLKVMIVGASGSWQALGVGTFKAGACPTGSNAGCAHYTNGNFNLTDTRPSVKSSSNPNVTDAATVWIVWDNTTNDPNCATACNVWAYAKVDSIVGNRCYFANPRCNVNVSPFPASQQKISATVWGADSTPPGPVQALFTTGSLVNVAASEIRAEDAAFGQCRINSTLGGGNDGLNGLGYGTSASGTCPAFGAALSVLEGHDLHSAYPGSTQTAHPMAFNISGKDPFTNLTVPAFSTISVGAVPLIFITDQEDANGLKGVTNVSLHQLQTVFSGTSCLGSDLGGGTDNINVYQREPLSGTMNAAEYTAFRLPRNSAGNYDTVNGASQETGIGGIDPVSNLTCGAGGGRYRSVGNGDETSFIQNSQTNFSLDGIGYMFFSYGNVSVFNNNSKYAYLSINGVDPIFQLYGTTYDPGQPAVAGELPGVSNLTLCAGTFPCAESKIWKGGESFPNVRNGSYRQWIMVRLMAQTGSAAFNAANALVTSTRLSAVTTVPDFIPAVAAGVDPGLKLLRSHYTQMGVVPTNVPDKGGDVGGCIIPAGSTAVKLVERDPACTAGP